MSGNNDIYLLLGEIKADLRRARQDIVLIKKNMVSKERFVYLEKIFYGGVVGVIAFLLSRESIDFLLRWFL